MQKIFFLSCFLIISSCDLPNEANTDCNGIQGGLAETDDCGRCSGGNTDIIPNQDKDCNGECFGDSYLDNCEVCDDIAINDGITCTECDDSIIELSDEIGSLCDCDGNIIDSCGECGGEGYIDCLCESYITSNTDFNCETNGNFPYNIGDQLGCETLETSFDICYPEDCGTIKLADFEDKIIFIIYEQDW